MIIESILAFIGIFVGLLIAKYTKEEFKAGKKYFIILYKSILFLLIIYLLYFVNLDWTILLFMVGFVITLFFSNLYFYLGLAVFSSASIYVAFFVFLLGLPYGTLLFHKKNVKKYLKYSFIFFVLSSLVLLFDFVWINYFIAGSLFSFFLRKVL
ncbi:hypothetical protein HON86_03410 [Candidatus Woesearchaeota archaeon]|jgi:hypothetical protein|nr:hypothetical protein [Candidatus Woesearchaeota archaeon]MBT6735398.1 hypothetical protein [Candidatus Woesearchaeota archaeon]MBT7169721.1 hypothetical protein [Candidatus Woesearchaeota archaeon]MBT7474671.1 hypothetical protein [Candidatus Woesearchaeota archaeon]